MKNSTTRSQPTAFEPIALVGIGCRFPGEANNPSTFWQLLRGAKDAVREVPPGRWDTRRYYHSNALHPGTMHVRHGGFLDGIDLFDAEFFNISAMEANNMDPQQRLLLEATWEAMEDAGLVPARLAGSQTGVFVGIFLNDYEKLSQQDPAQINGYTNAGGAFSIVANRLSYVFDFHGPSLAVDTACSSSLVAVHLACESLWSGESTLALAGGVNILLNPNVGVGLTKASMVSSRGQCRSFDAAADGYVRGEGVGMVVLKPLSRALADNDPIYCLIRATGVNQDGRTPSLHFPGQTAQEALLRHVYAKAGVAPHQVSYVEAHGTGTPTGDPVECRALGAIFSPNRSLQQSLHIGSVKTNIGHLESAAGMAGLIKAALILKHRELPANLHFDTPNPQIPFDDLRLTVQQQLEPLPDQADPSIVGVNSFGFGGTNAHIVLQEYRYGNERVHSSESEPERTIDSDAAFLLPLSARHPQALRALAQAYLALLDDDDAPSLHDLCFTASQRREHHLHRLALVARSHIELKEKLQAFLDGDQRSGIANGIAQKDPDSRIVFVFSGNGPQWWGMGRQLFAQNALFRDVIERCDQQLRALSGWSLRDELFRDEASSLMERTDIAQPALFAIQAALAEVWKSWGIEPQAVVGHSVGEIAAAYVAGILSFEDAIQVVFHRSRLQELTAGRGQMVAIGISAEAAHDLLVPFAQRVSIASINSPQSITLSGEPDALEQITGQLLERGIFCRFLKLNYAFHHQTMDSIEEELRQSLRAIRPQPGRIPFISTVSGAPLNGAACDADYWWRNVRASVQFEAAIRHCIDQERRTAFLEIGPHPVLTGYLNECLGERPRFVFSSLRRREDEPTQLLHGLGALYTWGASVCWQNVVIAGKYVSLPLYPWQRERYWVEPSSEERRWVHPLLGYRLALARPAWENRLDGHDLLYLRDHQIDGVALFPAAGYVDMLLAAAKDVFRGGAYELSQLKILRPLFLNDDGTSTVQTLFSPADGGIQVLGDSQDGWLTYASAKLAQLPLKTPSHVNIDEIRARCRHEIVAREFYAACQRRGYQYGPAFQLLERLHAGEQEMIGLIQSPPATYETEYLLHPTLLDACIHMTLALLPTDYLPVEIERLRCAVQTLPNTRIYSHVRILTHAPDSVSANCRLLSEDGQVLMEMRGLRLQAARLGARRAVRALEEHIYGEAWFPKLLKPRQRNNEDVLTPSELMARARPAIERINHDLPTDRLYRLALPSLNRLSLAYLLTALHKLGWDMQIGEQIVPSGLLERLGVLPHYERLLNAACMILAEEGILSPNKEGWMVTRKPELSDLQSLERALLTDHPEHHLTTLLLMHCGQRMTEIFTGAEDPRAVLFADGDTSLLEHFYTNELLFRRSNCIAQEALKQLVAQLPEGKPLRILEIGAGTGGTTSYLLPVLPADRTVYCFTDVSDVFLERARKKYRDYPFVEFRRFDMELDLLEQGFTEQSFDLIVATNVVHATTNLRRSLDSVYRLLAEQGLLCLIESTHPLSRTLLFIFGLLKEFWSFRDTDLRPSLPFLVTSAWSDLLAELGFSDVAVLSHQLHVEQAEQTVLLAQRPPATSPAEALATPAQTVVIFADNLGLATQLAATLKVSNVILVHQGNQYQQHARNRFSIRPQCREDLQQLFETLRQQKVVIEQLVYLWGLHHPSDDLSADVLKQAVDDSCLSLIYLVQKLPGLVVEGTALPRLCIVTSGTQYLPDQKRESPAITQAPLYGLTRVLTNEHPELRTILIALSAPEQMQNGLAYASTEVHALCEEIEAVQMEDCEILFRGTARFVNRIVRTPLQQRLPSDQLVNDPTASFRLEATTAGGMDPLQLRAIRRHMPGAGEVEIEVAAAGLNFRDVALATGMIPTESRGITFGSECAGTIVAVGPGVDDFRVGEEVIAIGAHGFSPFVTVDVRCAVRKPACLNMDEAASVAVAGLTASYALHFCAHLRQGERVLVHNATDGVGLMAIQIIQRAGAEVFATADSPEKRSYLRSLGVTHVFDSRSLTFADDILRVTNAEGVDIVLNSPTGAGAARSLDVLRPFGRFVESDQRGFFQNNSLNLQHFRRALSYFAVDTDRLITENTALASNLLREIVGYFERGDYRPLPYETFQLAQVNDAFRWLQQARQIGNVAVSLRLHAVPVVSTPETQSIAFRPDASYMVTGGAGGFGLATARWLVERGARSVILVSRSGMPSEESQRTIKEMEQAGASVCIEKADVSKADAVVALLERVRSSCPPLRGIVHAAAVFNNQPINLMDEAGWSSSLAGKMLGAWHLHVATKTLPLEFFVLYSSVASLLGNERQVDYAAANKFLDLFARYRRAQGLPALTIGWGALKKVGVVSRDAAVSSYLNSVGFLGMDPEPALDLMGQCLLQEREYAVISNTDWNGVNGAWFNTPARSRWTSLLAQQPTQADLPQVDVGTGTVALENLTPEARLEFVSTRVREELARLLRSSAAEIDAQQTLPNLGVDSLMTVELRMSLKRALGVDIPAMQLLRPQSLADLFVGIAALGKEKSHASVS